ncbi:MAG: FGGY family carbohydrate kinase [Ancalomicrobiaceae bacterium]|nr:FGGY family carbohydrate kinase [Ancalomicrobiaceae bacterium]
MSAAFLLAIDQGTTNTKAVLVDGAGRIVLTASAPMTSAYPHPGWAEQSADDIWATVAAVIADIAARLDGRTIAAIAITNQRETLVTWDRITRRPVTPAILWQCRRSAEDCDAIRATGADAGIVEATGLSLNPLFPASKLGWLLKRNADVKVLADSGRLAAGTVDSWLLYQLTGAKRFATDHSNASRTQLFNTATLSWDADLCRLFGVPIACLPEALPSDSRFGETAAGVTTLPAGIPIHAMMGDSHAALYGHGVRAPGAVKATYGTGSSLMTLTPTRVASRHGLSGTIAWSRGARTAYALEGNITVSAQAASFMAKLIGLKGAPELSDLARTVSTSNGVAFVPALAGLGAPHWDDYATGLVTGMTLSTTPAHVARATFEAIALQIYDVFTAMEQDIGAPLEALLADGGASANPFLMQLQADILAKPVNRSDVAELSAIGVAAMAASALGLAAGEPAAAHAIFEPAAGTAWRDTVIAGWHAAIARAKSG